MRGYVALVLLLAAIWGASFMFIKIAVDELAPTTTMFLRLAFSAIPLLALVVYKLGLKPAVAELRAITRAAIILGVGNTALPIFVALLAFRFRKSERATGSRLFGVLLGLAGVAVLAGVDPKGGWAGVAGTLAVVAASLSYAV